MMIIGRYKFKNEVHYYNYVMHKFFRKNPPLPTHIYLQFDATPEEAVVLKKLVASNCHFPAILNVLAHDDNDEVRNAVYQSTYWQLVGRYQDILGFGKRERKAFAKNEDKHNIFILLMFEDDPEVFKEVLSNPAISLTMLVRFIQLLRKRGKGRRDELFLSLAKQALARKKDQIIKLSILQRLLREPKSQKNVDAILPFLVREESLLKKALFNALRKIDQDTLKRIVLSALNEEHFASSLQQFKAISFLLEIMQKRRETDHLRYSDDPQVFVPHNEYLWKLLVRKRYNIVKNCAEDLSDFNNILLLTYCHVDRDPQLRTMASKILAVEDILELANDTTTPRKIFQRILNILENHFDEAIVNKVQESYLQESQRLKEALKEMERTVEAYFDIVFQSLGYDKINGYRTVVETFDFARKQLKKYESQLEARLSSELNQLEDISGTIQEVFQEWIDTIYYETSDKTLRELDYVKQSLEEILNLKDLGQFSLRPGTAEDIESGIRIRAHIIWRSAISIYLGRIKDLSEMLQRKILKLARTQYRNHEFIKDFKEALLDLEREYRREVDCPKSVPCRRCNRRGCAAERFLRETYFLTEQLLDNFADFFVASHKSASLENPHSEAGVPTVKPN